MAYNHGVTKVRGVLASSRSIDQYSRQLHCFAKIKLQDVTWQRKVDPFLDNLTLDRLVLDLSDSFCEDDDCKFRMAAMAILCFKKGFASRAPKIVEVEGGFGSSGKPAFGCTSHSSDTSSTYLLILPESSIVESLNSWPMNPGEPLSPHSPAPKAAGPGQARNVHVRALNADMVRKAWKRKSGISDRDEDIILAPEDEVEIGM